MNNNILSNHVVAVYSVCDKKCIYIFNTFKMCEQLLGLKDKTIYNLIKYRRTNIKNRTGVNLAFRSANKDQVALLGTNSYLCLDLKYLL